MIVWFSLVKCSVFVFTQGTKSLSNFISTIILLSSYFSLAMNLRQTVVMCHNSAAPFPAEVTGVDLVLVSSSAGRGACLSLSDKGTPGFIGLP